MIHLIIAESLDEFLDYIDVYKLPKEDTVYITRNYPKEKLFGFRDNNFTIHFTKFAHKHKGKVIQFIDLQIELSQKSYNVKTHIETENGVVVSANISFLKT